MLTAIPKLKSVRLQNPKELEDRAAYQYFFYPPADTYEWPKRIGDIGDTDIKECLRPRRVGDGAVGSKSKETPLLYEHALNPASPR